MKLRKGKPQRKLANPKAGSLKNSLKMIKLYQDNNQKRILAILYQHQQ